MNILMISANFPYPPDRGGTEIRTFNLLRYLNKNHNVTLVCQVDETVTPSETDKLRKYTGTLVTFPGRKRLQNNKENWLDQLYMSFQVLRLGKPPSSVRYYSVEMRAWIDKFLGSNPCDVITCEHSSNEIYIGPKVANSIRVVINAHSSRLNQFKSLQRAQSGTWTKIKSFLYSSLVLYRYERTYIKKASIIVATTAEDREHFLHLSQEVPIKIVPNGVDLDLFPFRNADPGGCNLVFVGSMDAAHNIDAVCYFCRDIFPLLKQVHPNLVLNIVGSRPKSEVLELRQINGVNVLGRVDSVVDYLHKATICIAPLRAGYGIKNKTLEAFATGVPLVGSDRALEGLDIDGDRANLCALRANAPEEYLASVKNLIDDSNLRTMLSENARIYVEKHFSWDRAGTMYENALIN